MLCCEQIVGVAIPCMFLIAVPGAVEMMGGAPVANGSPVPQQWDGCYDHDSFYNISPAAIVHLQS